MAFNRTITKNTDPQNNLCFWKKGIITVAECGRSSDIEAEALAYTIINVLRGLS
jgi:hypothetical protein